MAVANHQNKKLKEPNSIGMGLKAPYGAEAKDRKDNVKTKKLSKVSKPKGGY
jgi:hypothetical protein